ncbi:MAG: hypothetical protein ACYTGH_14885, partial [Planctomycetota bacterium]
GEESATYTQGTNTRTDTETFLELPLHESPSIQPGGDAEGLLPLDTMHSFEAENNKIEWSIQVTGEIPWWPDIDESFPVTVLPLRPEFEGGGNDE